MRNAVFAMAASALLFLLLAGPASAADPSQELRDAWAAGRVEVVREDGGVSSVEGVFSDRAVRSAEETEAMLSEMEDYLGKGLDMDEAVLYGEDGAGEGATRYRWSFEKGGIPVEDSSVTVVTDPDGRVFSLRNSFVDVPDGLSREPVLSSEGALDAALESRLPWWGKFAGWPLRDILLGLARSELDADEEPGLVFAEDGAGNVRLAWRTAVPGRSVLVAADRVPAEILEDLATIHSFG